MKRRCPALFLNRRGGRPSARAVEQLMDELTADAGVLALSAHILRHTLAANLLHAGVDVVVAELLGHARPDTHGGPPCPPTPTSKPPPAHRPVGRP